MDLQVGVYTWNIFHLYLLFISMSSKTDHSKAGWCWMMLTASVLLISIPKLAILCLRFLYRIVDINLKECSFFFLFKVKLLRLLWGVNCQNRVTHWYGHALGIALWPSDKSVTGKSTLTTATSDSIGVPNDKSYMISRITGTLLSVFFLFYTLILAKMTAISSNGNDVKITKNNFVGKRSFR